MCWYLGLYELFGGEDRGSWDARLRDEDKGSLDGCKKALRNKPVEFLALELQFEFLKWGEISKTKLWKL